MLKLPYFITDFPYFRMFLLLLTFLVCKLLNDYPHIKIYWYDVSSNLAVCIPFWVGCYWMSGDD